MSGEGEFENSLEFTPTWVMAGVCTVMVVISYAVLHIFYRLRKFLSEHQKPIYQALQKVTEALLEELVLLGLISLVLTFSENLLTKICVPPGVFHHNMLLPCSPADRRKAEAERQAAHPTTSSFCSRKNKVPLLSAETVHQIHIFVFLLGAVHIILSFIIFYLGSVTIQCWKKYEKKYEKDKTEREFEIAMTTKLVDFRRSRNYRFFGLMVLWESFSKQFIGFVKKSDYMALQYGFSKSRGTFMTEMVHFHPYMSRSHEDYFKQIVGISWYLWVSVVVFLLLNVHGWHAYFWISFIPAITLIIMGTILERIVTQLVVEISEKYAREIGSLDLLIEPSDKHFWFDRPSLVLHLIHFILLQNAFQIAIFLWIGITFGFDSCMMEQLYYSVPRLIIGIFILTVCGFSTLPLYTIVTQMGTNFKEQIVNDAIESKSESDSDSEPGHEHQA